METPTNLQPFDSKASFIVVGQDDTNTLKQSIRQHQEFLKSSSKPLDKTKEDEYTSTIREAKDNARNQFKGKVDQLKHSLNSMTPQINTIRELVTSTTAKLDQASRITNVEDQKRCISTYRSESNALENFKKVLSTNLDTVYNNHWEPINKLNPEPIKGKRTPEDSDAYLQKVYHILGEFENYAAAFFKNVAEVETKINECIGVTSKKVEELTVIEKCLTEVILPELSRRQQWELISEAFLKGYEQLNSKEIQTKRYFIECLKPRDEEIILPREFLDLLTKGSKEQEPAVPEDWNNIKEASLSLPERMLKTYQHTANSCYNMKECDKATEELTIVEDEIEAENRLAKELEEQTAQLADEIAKELEKAKNSSESLNLEQAEVSELKAEIAKLVLIKNSQDLLIKQKKEAVGGLEKELAHLTVNNEKANADAEVELKRAIEDFNLTQRARYDKKAELQALQNECEKLEKEKVRYDTIFAANDKKAKESDQLEIETNLIKHKIDILRGEIQKLKNPPK